MSARSSSYVLPPALVSSAAGFGASEATGDGSAAAGVPVSFFARGFGVGAGAGVLSAGSVESNSDANAESRDPAAERNEAMLLRVVGFTVFWFVF
jgi:hypothetical protein